MNKLRTATTLTILQLILLTHLLILLTTPTPTAQIIAQGGTTKQVNQGETNNWGGSYGELTTNGATAINTQPYNITKNNIYYNDTNNNCTKTELIATTNNLPITNIQPINPITADQNLNINPNNPFSITNTFTEQITYDIQGTAITLWSTRTQGGLTQFLQGVATTNGNTTFITTTIRNARAYNDEPANYQLLLPAGTWYITYDEQDTCDLLNEYETLIPTQQNITRRLSAAIPTRICAGTTNTFYAVRTLERLYCRAEETPSVFCEPEEDVQVTITTPGRILYEEKTTEEGIILFTPTQFTTHTITLTKESEITTHTFRANDCRELETGSTTIPGSSTEIITLEQPTITRSDINLGVPDDPQAQMPLSIISIARTELILILALGFAVVLIAGVGYYERKKDTVVTLLKIRIWLTQKLK